MPKYVMWAISYESLEELFRENFRGEESPELDGVAIDEIGGLICLRFRISEDELERLAQEVIASENFEFINETETQLN